MHQLIVKVLDKRSGVNCYKIFQIDVVYFFVEVKYFFAPLLIEGGVIVIVDLIVAKITWVLNLDALYEQLFHLFAI